MRYFPHSINTYGIKGLANDTEWNIIKYDTNISYLCYYFYLFCNNNNMIPNISSYENITPEDNIHIYLPTNNQGVNYTELGIFISGIILSVGGFIALLLGNIRKSNCSEIKCSPCFYCKRENLDIDAP